MGKLEKVVVVFALSVITIGLIGAVKSEAYMGNAIYVVVGSTPSGLVGASVWPWQPGVEMVIKKGEPGTYNIQTDKGPMSLRPGEQYLAFSNGTLTVPSETCELVYRIRLMNGNERTALNIPYDKLGYYAVFVKKQKCARPRFYRPLPKR